MGGNAFNTETFTAKRVNKQEYYEILEQLLDEICNIIIKCLENSMKDEVLLQTLERNKIDNYKYEIIKDIYF